MSPKSEQFDCYVFLTALIRTLRNEKKTNLIAAAYGRADLHTDYVLEKIRMMEKSWVLWLAALDDNSLRRLVDYCLVREHVQVSEEAEKLGEVGGPFSDVIENTNAKLAALERLTS